jgi:hypothetical protein
MEELAYITLGFSKREQVKPVILIVAAGDAQISLKGLIHSFRLTIGLGMEGGTPVCGVAAFLTTMQDDQCSLLDRDFAIGGFEPETEAAAIYIP